MRCDMCGSEEQLYKTNVEGAVMEVCSSCSKYGEVISKVVKPKPKAKVPDRPEIITIIDKNYPRLIKKARESRGLKQDELAKRLGEKSSVIHQLETGHMEPSMKLARKLEKFLNISLVKEYEEKSDFKSEKKSGALTIGDMISID